MAQNFIFSPLFIFKAEITVLVTFNKKILCNFLITKVVCRKMEQLTCEANSVQPEFSVHYHYGKFSKCLVNDKVLMYGKACTLYQAANLSKVDSSLQH
jgi:hypothetical protein